MKFLAIAALLFVPAVWAASVPYQCKTLAESAYLTADGPQEIIEFFNVSKVSAGDGAYYIQKDGHPYNGDDISSDSSFAHQCFNLARCQLRSSSSSLPQSYYRVHLSSDANQCLTVGGAGPAKSTPPKESFTEPNTLVMKPCAHPSSSDFKLQIFKDNGDEATYPYYIETIESDDEVSRLFVGFKDDKVYLMSEEPESASSPPGNFKLYVDKFA